MSPDQNGDTRATSSTKPNNQSSETTSLLPKKTPSTPPKKQRRKWPKSVVYRVLLTSFLVSLSFAVTQVPLIYVFGIMSCDEYYTKHKSPPIGTPAYDQRCRHREIEASTARAVALLGASNTFFGVANLFFTGWMIKVWGVKTSLLVTISWPALRLLVQNIGVQTGAGLGIMIVQLSQITTIIGGPVGYLLSLNSYATELVSPAKRTATIGRVSGCQMFGNALGFLFGGLLSDWFGKIVPFRVALVLFCISALYSFIFLPWIPIDLEDKAKATMSLSSFLAPLRMFTPRKWILRNGTVQREYGVLLLGTGAFLAVFATGYIVTMLQMFSTDVLNFGASDNSRLISINFAIRACFLTFAFPIIISKGRQWLDGHDPEPSPPDTNKPEPTDSDSDTDLDTEPILPTEPQQIAAVAQPVGQSNATEPDETLNRTTTTTSTIGGDENESFAFDLLYTRYSLILDGVITALASFATRGWHVYLFACLVPLAAGTGSAAKGVMLQMCAPDQKNDALSAISLIELAARLSTVSVFGVIFSAFAAVGRPNLTFAVNGAVAAVGFVVLLLARFPPEGAVRYEKGDGEESGEDG